MVYQSTFTFTLFKAHRYGICIPDEQKLTGTLTNIIWKEQEENQPLMPVNKCFPEFLSYSLIPDLFLCQLFPSANLLIADISQVLF